MTRRIRARTGVAVGAAYAAQGLGYASVVTTLPALKSRVQIDDTGVTLIVLGVCIAAAAGSLLADVVAVRLGSRIALVLGLALQAVALPVIAFATPLPPFLLAFAVYGLGLGCVDAASAMQGVSLQRSSGRSVLGRLFASYTAAAILGALLVAGAAATALDAGTTLLIAAVAAAAVAVVGVRAFSTERPERAASGPRPPLPRRGVWAFGLVVLAAFVVDSAVSTWSTVYLQDSLATTAALAPFGYAAYQGAVLLTRLATDPLVARVGRRGLVAASTLIAMAGCVLVASLPLAAAAIVGFALAGVATGALVPAAFGAAGELDPERADEVIARVNLFNYAGAVLGAVAVGLVGDVTGLGIAFVVPAVALLAVLTVLRRFTRRSLV